MTKLSCNKLLITGVSGQLGKNLIKKCMTEQIDFSGLDLVEPLDSSNFEFLKIDLRNKNELEKMKNELNQFDSVIHLASTIDTSLNVPENGLRNIELNILGSLNLMKYLPNLAYFCYAGTYMVYGIPKRNPVKENHSTNPINVYGISKLITEKYLQVYARRKNFKFSILRFMGIYGTDNLNTVQAIPSFIQLINKNKNPIIFGTGKSKRNHLFIDDAVSAVLTFLKYKKHGTFNIGGNDSIDNLELISLINKKMGKTIKPIFKEPMNVEYDFIADISLAKNTVNFIPEVGIIDGISRTVEKLMESK